jgi:hypothetical protein
MRPALPHSTPTTHVALENNETTRQRFSGGFGRQDVATAADDLLGVLISQVQDQRPRQRKDRSPEQHRFDHG